MIGPFSSGESRSSPKPIFCSTVNQGNTPFSWNTKIRWGSGPDTGVPLTNTSPTAGLRKPAMMFSRVDLPQPEGPTMQTNSPRTTSKSMLSRTTMGAVLPANCMLKPRTWMIGRCLSKILIPLRITPLHFVEEFQLSNQEIQEQTDESNHEHAGHDQVVPFSGVSGIDDQVTKPGVYRDHFGGNDNKPGDTHRDAKTGENLRKAGGKNDSPKKRKPAQAEVLGRAHVDRLNILNGSQRRNGDGKDAGQKNKENGRPIIHPKPQYCDRDPSNRRNRPQYLNNGVYRPEGGTEPPQSQAERHADESGQSEPNTDPKQRSDDVIEKYAAAN